MYASQRKFVEEAVRFDGKIGRNQCLRNYISRLSSIICDMQKNGYVFETSRVETDNRWGKGYDYIYTAVTQPTDPIY